MTQFASEYPTHQPAEQVWFKNSRHLKLAGLFHTARSNSAIVMAHGFTNDKSSQGRFDELADCFNRSGYNVLRFDFSGCGESDRDILATHNMVDDLQCAVAFVRSRNCTSIALYGQSLGGLICLKCAESGIQTMVLVGAITDSMAYDWTKYYTEDQLRELIERGYLVAQDRSGKDRHIGKQILRSFNEINQRDLFSRVSCPVLLIHGDDPDDEEELLLLERSRRGVKLLPGGSRLDIIHGANHSFQGRMGRVVDLATRWYLGHVPT